MASGRPQGPPPTSRIATIFVLRTTAMMMTMKMMKMRMMMKMRKRRKKKKTKKGMIILNLLRSSPALSRLPFAGFAEGHTLKMSALRARPQVKVCAA
jgi:hypothetical protein